MIRIAVVEDNPECQRILVSYIRDFFAGREAYDCAVFDDGVDFLAAAMQVDLLFLDIVMAHTNGIEVARRVRERDANAVIVFVTEAVQYALEGYGVHALDFLVKPLYYTSFCTTVQRALDVFKRRAPNMLRIDYDKTVSYVDIASIFSIETSSKKTLLHAQSGDYWSNGTMKELEEKLAPFGFARCHQAYIVNVAYVESVRKKEVLVHGQWIPLSRYRREEFIARLVKEVGAMV